MKFSWQVDGDGDQRLLVDGEYFGLVCPHNLPKYAIAVWNWGDKQMVGPTVEGMKRHLERAAKSERAADEAYALAWAASAESAVKE